MTKKIGYQRKQVIACASSVFVEKIPIRREVVKKLLILAVALLLVTGFAFAGGGQEAAPPTPIDSPVVDVLSKAINRVTGLTAKPMGIGGGTVAAFFRRAGLHAAVWSTVSPTAHQPNEYCSLKNIMTDAKIMATVFLN